GVEGFEVVGNVHGLIERAALAVVRERPAIEVMHPGEPADAGDVHGGVRSQAPGCPDHPFHVPEAGENRDPRIEFITECGDESGDVSESVDTATQAMSDRR